jgi:hypothetical protein
MNPISRENKIIRISKKVKPDSESNYSPGNLGRNQMKVMRSIGRLPHLLSSSLGKTKKGDFDENENTEKSRHRNAEEAKLLEIEVAVGCLLGSRLDVNVGKCMRNNSSNRTTCKGLAGKRPDKTKTHTKKKSNKQGPDQKTPG